MSHTMFNIIQSPLSEAGLQVSDVSKGHYFEVGEGFSAHSFRHTDYAGLMDPLIMVDHYTMSKPTFGAHPHAGLAAVSLLFEDSEGQFRNRDSMGNDFDLLAGRFVLVNGCWWRRSRRIPTAGLSNPWLTSFC